MCIRDRGAAGEHAGAEGGVELVTGEGDPVHVQVAHRDGVVRGELGGVQHDPGAVGVRGGGQFAHRPQFTGDVGGAGDADQGRAVRLPGGEGAFQGLDGLCGGARGVQVRHVRVAPGQQRGVVLGLEDEDPAAGRQRAGEEVQGVGGGPGEDHLVAVPAVQELGDGPAGVLEQVGRQLRQVPGPAVHAAVVRGVGRHVVPDPLEGGRAGGVVERGVGDLPAGDERDGDVPAENGQRGGDSGGHGHGGLP